ncbi:MAG: hypothetical protein WAL80_19850 [Xanthobacteraceae bacterium]
MTRLALLTAAALVAFSAAASAQNVSGTRGDKLAAPTQSSQVYSYQAVPLILGVAY